MSRSQKTAFVFPGVGVKHCGAERGFVERHRSTMEKALNRASHFAGRPFLTLLQEEKIEALKDKEQQFFTYAFSTGVADVLFENGVAADFAAGYSFGIYGALYASGSIDFETGLKILSAAYKTVKETTGDTPSGMGVVVGLGKKNVQNIIARMVSPKVSLATTNSESCHVVSGHKTSVEEFLKIAEGEDAFSADLLPVEIPYHHPEILSRAVPQFREFLAEEPMRAPRIPLISSIDQQIIATKDALLDFVAKNLAWPIDWSRVALKFHEEGVVQICECGPGISLTQNGRFLPFQDASYINIKNATRRLNI